MKANRQFFRLFLSFILISLLIFFCVCRYFRCQILSLHRISFSRFFIFMSFSMENRNLISPFQDKEPWFFLFENIATGKKNLCAHLFDEDFFSSCSQKKADRHTHRGIQTNLIFNGKRGKNAKKKSISSTNPFVFFPVGIHYADFVSEFQIEINQILQ